MDIISSVENNKYLSKKQKIIIEVLIIYNCRISEVLEASWKDFYPGKFLILAGKKGSDDVIIRDRFLLQQIDSLPRSSKRLIFSQVTYYQIYSLVKKNYSHLFTRFRKGKNYKVTHGFRYLNVSNIDSEDSVKSILHHRSKKSGKYYK